MEAYRNILPASVFPVALIFLELPAAEVDVNVHPSKIEVRFRHSGFIHDLVRDALRRALLATRPVAPFPMARPSREMPVDTEAAEVAEKLEEDAGQGHAVQNPLVETTPAQGRASGPWQDRRGTPWRAPTPPFKLSSPIPEPRTTARPKN